MLNESQAFAALADPTRRAILDRLADGPAHVRVLTEAAGVSQPAVSQHLKKLKAAGLVTATPKGASTVYALDPTGLGPVRAALDRYWNAALDRFRRLAEEEEDPA